MEEQEQRRALRIQRRKAKRKAKRAAKRKAEVGRDVPGSPRPSGSEDVNPRAVKRVRRNAAKDCQVSSSSSLAATPKTENESNRRARRVQRRKEGRRARRESKDEGVAPPSSPARAQVARVPLVADKEDTSTPSPSFLKVTKVYNGRRVLLNTLTLLNFAEVDVCHRQQERTNAANVAICSFFYGYAQVHPLASLHNPSVFIGDKRAGRVFFSCRTRALTSPAIGPVVLFDTNQESANVNGGMRSDGVPKQALGPNRQGDILMGIMQANTNNAEQQRSKYKMVWWNGNGRRVLRFVQALQGSQAEDLRKLRVDLRQPLGCKDGLFAVYKLVVLGDIGYFVRHHTNTLSKSTASDFPPLQLGADGDNCLRFAVQIARSLCDEELERDICDAAKAADVDVDTFLPPVTVTPFDIQTSPLLEPVSQFANDALRRGRPMHSVIEDYAASVDTLTPDSVIHAGFMAAIAQLESNEMPSTPKGAPPPSPPPPVAVTSPAAIPVTSPGFKPSEQDKFYAAAGYDVAPL